MSVLTAITTQAQAIVTTGVERDAQRDAFWRITYDNDFFTATDYYFTQGIHIEIVNPALRHSRLAKVLIRPGNTTQHVGIAYEDDGYTATDLKASQILRNDHPYVGTKQLRVFGVSADSIRRQRITSSLNVGIVGQGAGGKEIQTFIHRQTGNTIPQGWGNQIRNDVILNYEANVERQLYRGGNRVLVTGTAGARAGTFNTALTIGPTLMVGRIGSPFSAHLTRGRMFHVYLKPQLNIVGYDATLQGGLFNRSSPYTIPSGDVSRLVIRSQAGFVFRSGNRYLEYYQSVGTREFRGGLAHRSGGIAIGFLRAP
ncbi:MAG: lipid A deacylase LpxR family protein [Gemmatimonadaceae bacterium]|nr:lipid A deacylase LpxR family protein [Gemmatimonadaceae bacterium]